MASALYDIFFKISTVAFKRSFLLTEEITTAENLKLPLREKVLNIT